MSLVVHSTQAPFAKYIYKMNLLQKQYVSCRFTRYFKLVISTEVLEQF